MFGMVWTQSYSNTRPRPMLARLKTTYLLSDQLIGATLNSILPLILKSRQKIRLLRMASLFY